MTDITVIVVVVAMMKSRNVVAVAASLVSPGDLELTPFRAYSAIYYGHTRCSNNCANTTRDCLHT